MLLQRDSLPNAPVVIESIDVLRVQNRLLVRSRSHEGDTGYALANERLNHLLPVLQNLVIPYFLGKDARALESGVEGVFAHASNYKLAGIAFWNCVAHVEFSLLDMMGKMVEKPVGALFSEILRPEIPIYLSSGHRDTTPEREVAWLEERLAESGARAIKIKIGGRMSKGADATPGRSEKLVSLARERFGPAVTIYVDANGSYNAQQAIEVGHMLEAYEVGFLEEPCPFLEFEETKAVADALELPVVGGEQDTSMAMFQWMIRNRAVDMVQPDLLYNGGMIRCLQVAQMAAKAGLSVTPHSPKHDPVAGYMLHFAAIVPNLGPYQEFQAERRPKENWYSPALAIRNGTVRVPDGPGLGFQYDEGILNQAEVIHP